MSAPDIFYVEDDTDFAFIMQQAVKEVDDRVSISIIENGIDALEMLHQLTTNSVKPKLILLDLNLPGLSGLDLVRRIREIPYLKYVPVIFFTTSENPKDIKASMEFGANAYLTKPSGYLNLISCLRSLHDFWFTKHLNVN
ncbi:response regulator receiver domain-containing protein [Mucilaginibacter yixingensis]|uniref:Response regulator receiver domain-containing protein n=1 Tax=Mucilaginibacter yixingensis TaxID=1295612 RepID=A0A2T5J737_9SPHI|nr:response regulator [Mucilaginibacter yixingensis]PTQ94919.1 response regulator receiver domain-containing protein [Mucilaginibacter yixingensis]